MRKNLRSNVNWKKFNPDRNGAIENAPWCEGEKYRENRNRPHIYGCLPDSKLGDKYCVQDPAYCRSTYNDRGSFKTHDTVKQSLLYNKKGIDKLAQIYPELFEGQSEAHDVPKYDYSNDDSNDDSGHSTSYKAAESAAKGLWEGAKWTTWGVGKGLQGLWWSGKKGAEAISYLNQKRIEAQEEAEQARIIAERAERRAQILKEEEEKIRLLRHKKELREGKRKWHGAKEEYLPEEEGYLEEIDVEEPEPSYISEEYSDEAQKADIRNFPKKGPIYGYMPGWDELPRDSVPWNERHRQYIPTASEEEEIHDIDKEFLEQLKESTRGLGEKIPYNRQKKTSKTATMDIEEDPKVERTKATMDITYDPVIEKLDNNQLDDLIEWLESEIKNKEMEGFSEEDL